jgi:hypothetical protein
MCFKTIEKPVATQLHLFHFTLLTKAWYWITRYAREPRGMCFKTFEKLPLRGFSFLFLSIHPSKLGSVLK